MKKGKKVKQSKAVKKIANKILKNQEKKLDVNKLSILEIKGLIYDQNVLISGCKDTIHALENAKFQKLNETGS